jgi:hypothetical protein
MFPISRRRLLRQARPQSTALHIARSRLPSLSVNHHWVGSGLHLHRHAYRSTWWWSAVSGKKETPASTYMAPPAYAVATRSSDHRRSVKTQCTPSRGQRPDRLCIGNSYFSFIIGPAPPVAALSSLAWRRIIGVRADLDELRDSSFTARIPTKAAHDMIDTVACKANLLPPPVKPTCSLPLPSTTV